MTLYQDKYRIEPARLRGWDYRTSAWYFVTICVRDRACALGDVVSGQVELSRAGRVAESELRNLSAHYDNVTVDAFVVMPNHIHAIVVIDGPHRYSPDLKIPEKFDAVSDSTPSPPNPGSLSAIIRSYKAGVTRLCRRHQILDFAWQERFHDHILRSGASVNAVREYIQNNPKNWMQDRDNLDLMPTG